MQQRRVRPGTPEHAALFMASKWRQHRDWEVMYMHADEGPGAPPLRAGGLPHLSPELRCLEIVVIEGPLTQLTAEDRKQFTVQHVKVKKNRPAVGEAAAAAAEPGADGHEGGPTARNKRNLRASLPNYNTTYLVETRGLWLQRDSCIVVHRPCPCGSGGSVNHCPDPLILAVFINGNAEGSLGPEVERAAAGHERLWDEAKPLCTPCAERQGVRMIGLRHNTNAAMAGAGASSDVYGAADTCLFGYYSVADGKQSLAADPGSAFHQVVRSTGTLMSQLERSVSPHFGSLRQRVSLVRHHPGLLPGIPSSNCPQYAMGVSRSFVGPLHTDDDYGGLPEAIVWHTKGVPKEAGLSFCIFSAQMCFDLTSHPASMVMLQGDLVHGTPDLGDWGRKHFGCGPKNGHPGYGVVMLTKGNLRRPEVKWQASLLKQKMHSQEFLAHVPLASLFDSNSPFYCADCEPSGLCDRCSERDWGSQQAAVPGHQQQQQLSGAGSGTRARAPTGRVPPAGLALQMWDDSPQGLGEEHAFMRTSRGPVCLAPDVRGKLKLDRWHTTLEAPTQKTYVRLGSPPAGGAAAGKRLGARGAAPAPLPEAAGPAAPAADAAASTEYMTYRAFMNVSVEQQVRSLRDMLAELVPWGRATMPSMTEGEGQLWWAPFRDAFFTSRCVGQTDGLRRLTRKQAQALRPKAQLSKQCVTGLLLFDGTSGTAKELELGDWYGGKYREAVEALFDGTPAWMDAGGGGRAAGPAVAVVAAKAGMAGGRSKIAEEQVEEEGCSERVGTREEEAGPSGDGEGCEHEGGKLVGCSKRAAVGGARGEAAAGKGSNGQGKALARRGASERADEAVCSRVGATCGQGGEALGRSGKGQEKGRGGRQAEEVGRCRTGVGSGRGEASDERRDVGQEVGRVPAKGRASEQAEAAGCRKAGTLCARREAAALPEAGGGGEVHAGSGVGGQQGRAGYSAAAASCGDRGEAALPGPGRRSGSKAAAGGAAKRQARAPAEEEQELSKRAKHVMVRRSQGRRRQLHVEVVDLAWDDSSSEEEAEEAAGVGRLEAAGPVGQQGREVEVGEREESGECQGGPEMEGSQAEAGQQSLSEEAREEGAAAVGTGGKESAVEQEVGMEQDGKEASGGQAAEQDVQPEVDGVGPSMGQAAAVEAAAEWEAVGPEAGLQRPQPWANAEASPALELLLTSDSGDVLDATDA